MSNICAKCGEVYAASTLPSVFCHECRPYESLKAFAKKYSVSDEPKDVLAMGTIVRLIDQNMCQKCLQNNTGCTPGQVIECVKFCMNRAIDSGLKTPPRQPGGTSADFMKGATE